MQPPRRVPEDPLKTLEDEAYEACEDGSEEKGRRDKNREYAHIGGPIHGSNYRPAKLGEWPVHTDFLPDNLNVRD
jgi:hypothetical protein